ncbi:hypothetical protein [Marinoscillum furvescens]|uniref:Uncharacterized protein n=1 Tax=Marinoscillum furvescens DSM 4134 TaxID=1122208 RepID=A0A3D9L142_MARFU|nr:hypothetical protein [Marinoscillum furvescens]RED96251.1 hypothetical protein C7460_115142 [Marinoscillum furvescens DSM 4134]
MRFFAALVACVLCLSSCVDKVICPAFQSAYILDDSVRSVYYSYLWKIEKEERLNYLAGQQAPEPQVELDTTAAAGPVVAAAEGVDYFAYVEPFQAPYYPTEKTKFGIVKSPPFLIKNYQLRTAPMENILTPEPMEMPDTTSVDVGEFVASDFSDSVEVTLDTAAVLAEETAVSDTSEFELPSITQIEPPKTRQETRYLYGFDPKDQELNVEQAYYNKYFGEYLFRKVTVPIEQPAAADTTSAGDKEGFFQRLFGGLKKDKSADEAEDLTDELQGDDEIAPVDEDPLEEPQEESEED